MSAYLPGILSILNSILELGQCMTAYNSLQFYIEEVPVEMRMETIPLTQESENIQTWKRCGLNQ